MANKVTFQENVQTEQVDKFNKDNSNLVFRTKFNKDSSNSPNFSPQMEVLVFPVERAVLNVANKVIFQENVQIIDKEAGVEKTKLTTTEVKELPKLENLIYTEPPAGFIIIREIVDMDFEKYKI